MTNHTYLVTGGCGFLGQYIVQAIHTHDPQAEIRVLDLKPRSTLLKIESIPQVKLISGDLRQPYLFMAALAGVDTIIHSAGLVSFKKGDAENVYQANKVATENLVQAALACGCRNFLFISSISAIGRRPGQLSDETMMPDLAWKRQTDSYGYSKLGAEQVLQAYAHRMRSLIFNPSIILGPGSPRIAKVLQGMRWLPVCPMITTLNSFVDVRDVAKAVVLGLENGRTGERYIVTTENADMISFMKMVMALMGKKAPVFPIPDRFLVPFDLMVRLLDRLKVNPGINQSEVFHLDKAYNTDKIKRELCWQPIFSLEQSLEDTIMSFKCSQREEKSYEFPGILRET